MGVPRFKVPTFLFPSDKFIDTWVSGNQLVSMKRQYVKSVLLTGHRHRHEKGRPGDKKKNLKRTNTSENIREFRLKDIAISDLVILCVCVCACVCVRACVRACVC